MEAEQLVAGDAPSERAVAVGDEAVHRDAHRVDQHGLHFFVHDRSSLFRLPAEGIVRATNPVPTLDPSFAVGSEDCGEVSRFCRASLRAGVARLLARSVTVDEKRPITGRPFLVPLYVPHFTARSLESTSS